MPYRPSIQRSGQLTVEKNDINLRATQQLNSHEKQMQMVTCHIAQLNYSTSTVVRDQTLIKQKEPQTKKKQLRSKAH
jgi:hypothetical protein